MKNKQLSTSSPSFAKGGSNKMAPQQKVTASRPGVVSTSSPGNSSFGVEPGRSNHMAGQQKVAPSQPGGVTVSSPGNAPWGVKGGSGHMAGHSGADTAQPK